jgi:hypothetical protein
LENRCMEIACLLPPRAASVRWVSESGSGTFPRRTCWSHRPQKNKEKKEKPKNPKTQKHRKPEKGKNI